MPNSLGKQRQQHQQSGTYPAILLLKKIPLRSILGYHHIYFCGGQVVGVWTELLEPGDKQHSLRDVGVSIKAGVGAFERGQTMTAKTGPFRFRNFIAFVLLFRNLSLFPTIFFSLSPSRSFARSHARSLSLFPSLLFSQLLSLHVYLILSLYSLSLSVCLSS